jgi:signal transduction histidine kinase
MPVDAPAPQGSAPTAAAPKIAAVPDHSPLIAVADASVGRRIAAEVERFATTGRVVLASSLLELRLYASNSTPRVIGLDCDLLEDAPLADALAPFVAVAPVVVFGPVELHVEVAPLIVSGDVEFVARAGDFAPAVANLIERRLRWAEKSNSLLGPPWAQFPEDIGTIFRHEINNPLTGILVNAELLLAHRERLSAVDTQRLQIVVDLAVRLRETIRRLSNAWEQRPTPAKSA